MSRLKYFVFITLCNVVSVLSVSDSYNRSLTFAIDDTSSMYDDIDQVKQGSKEIFDTVMNSEKSQIDNFVLVTFNDPTTSLRTITKDRIEFKEALESIIVHGGDDCPEYCMTGIQRALENSHPGSYIYVFTDASAKDFEKYSNVKNLAVKMESQIVFVLTGMCGSEEDEDYQVYHKLAAATSGQVFHLGKQDVKEILEYVKYTIEGPTTLLASKEYPPGYGNKFNYTVDSKTKDPLISVTGNRPKVDVTGPDGTKPHAEHLIDMDNIAIVKLKHSIPGTHVVEVGSESETTVKVVARSEVEFKFGFSSFMPTTFDDVTSRPVPDKKSYITIKLIEGDINLHTVKILGMDEKHLHEIPLNKLNDKEKIYVTNLTNVPDTMFRIVIIGFDPETKTNITRVASSPVEPQRITERIVNKSPVVTIDKGKLTFDFDKSLKLTCKVHGYPKPSIIWIEEETGAVLPANVSEVELPYDFISVLELSHVKQNTTYKCKAENDLGSDSKEIVVENETFLQVLESPKNTTIEYNKEGKIYCNIKSYPKAKITWIKNEIIDTLTDNPNIEIITKDSNSILIIKNMQISDSGSYICEVNNGVERKLLRAQIDISGVEPPVIDKEIIEVNIKLHEDSNISCGIIQGIPKPTINWYRFFAETMCYPKKCNFTGSDF